ncbi:MAG: hypothetical protein H6728_00490 [Myxococcales bacterium]|nr:hypothetical protein [Myxococcales bacterium]MCB9641541.1 hypothetical protein [Myxococcales bacterium]
MEKRYNLVLTGLQTPTLDPEDLIQALRSQLHFESMTARLAVTRTPFTLLRDVSHEEGWRLKELLEEQGALVELQDPNAPSPLSNDPFGANNQAPAPLLGNFDAKWETAPAPTAFEMPFTTHLDDHPYAPSSPRQDVPPMAEFMAPSGPEVDFFGGLKHAFLMPLHGRGMTWMMLIGILTLVSLFAFIGVTIATILLPPVGWLVNLLIFGALLTLNARYFFATFSAAINNEDEPESFPDLSERRGELLMGGLVLLGWIVTSMLPLYFWLRSLGGRPQGFSYAVSLFLILLPFFFWPISLVQMASGSISRMWNFPASLKAISQTPLKYSLVVLLGFLAGLAPMLLSFVVRQSIGGGFMIGIFVMFLGCLPMAYSHGTMGAMMGYLALETPEILPDGVHNEE